MNDKKTLIIIVLSIIIVLLIWFIFSGNGKTQLAIDEISGQRIELQRANEIIKSENIKLRAESGKLTADNNEYKQLINDLRELNIQSGKLDSVYGQINHDFANFIKQNQPLE